MAEFSVLMALVDFIPVILFAWAVVLLQVDLYNKMSKGAFAFFAAGTINIVAAGALKALYKLLYAAGICDFQSLNTLFFPLQSIGFLMAGFGLFSLMLFKQSSTAITIAAPAVFSGTMIFVACMVIGLAGMCASLAGIAHKMKQKLPCVLFVVSFVCSLCMGYLSTKDFSSAMMNWIAQSVNILGQASFLWAAWLLNKAGLKDFFWKAKPLA